MDIAGSVACWFVFGGGGERRRYAGGLSLG